ncbi:MAG TPA: hypothetical protein VJ949_07065 [Cryomorphaceae bacterium]|nr:hypothetical protein [Cryomorphaceae bacterium]
MEILNKNHRKKSLLRLSAMGIIVLALTLTAIFAFHKAYAGQGQSEIEKLKNELQEVRAEKSVEVNALQNKMNRMKQQHEEELANKVSDVRIEQLEKQIDELKKEKKEFEEDSNFYKSEFRKCQLQN